MNHKKSKGNKMAKYKIESTYLQFPVIIETTSGDEAFEMFVAYCDYNGIDEDEIQAKHDNTGVVGAIAKSKKEKFMFNKIGE